MTLNFLLLKRFPLVNSLVDTTIWLNEPYKPQINASFSLILEVPSDLEKSCEEAKEGSKKTATIHQLAAGRFFY